MQRLAAGGGARTPGGRRASGTSIGWISGWRKTAVRESRAAGKPMLVDFWAEWCEWCHELDRTTYRDPAVVELSRGSCPSRSTPRAPSAEVGRGGRARREEPAHDRVPHAGRPRTSLQRTAYEGPEAFVSTLKEAQRAGAGRWRTRRRSRAIPGTRRRAGGLWRAAREPRTSGRTPASCWAAQARRGAARCRAQAHAPPAGRGGGGAGQEGPSPSRSWPRRWRCSRPIPTKTPRRPACRRSAAARPDGTRD